jgi:hypothetical protein
LETDLELATRYLSRTEPDRRNEEAGDEIVSANALFKGMRTAQERTRPKAEWVGQHDSKPMTPNNEGDRKMLENRPKTLRPDGMCVFNTST